MRPETIIRFEDVSFEFGPKKPILDAVSFSIRAGSKITLMGQNGAGKSTIFSLLNKTREPEEGIIHRNRDLTVALSRQTIPRAELGLSVREFFERVFPKKVYDIDPKIDAALEIVHFKADKTRKINTFSGGQQARLLLASALIQEPDILLLDEPTNNLDAVGIAHLTDYIKNFEHTCLVISHDADFLNSFSDGVLYLDIHTRKVEQYTGNYKDVVQEISARVEKENMKNAQLAKKIQENKDKANFFAHKGGKMRLVAKRMRAQAQEAEESMVDVRKEDKTIKEFTIACQEGLSADIFVMESYSRLSAGKKVTKKKHIALRKDQHLLLKGPNGIGKSTLLEAIAANRAEGITIRPGVKIGYYRQDFSNLDFEKTVHEELMSALDKHEEQAMRSIAASFLLTGELIHTKIGHLSEGQKGLVAFARLSIIKPGLLLLDEPTNHINFRHVPVIARALDSYKGTMILVSHVPEFVAKVRIDQTLDLEK